MKFIKMFAILGVVLSGCVSIPDNVKPVDNFNLNKYLGKWYEIARLENSFEKGLTKISAEYSLRDGGGVKVLNKGFSEKENKWKQAEGKAYFVEKDSTGYLKVSFFGPFYGAYAIIDLDYGNYNYALVCGGADKSYLWILARQPELNKEIINKLTNKAKALGFDTSKLIYVSH